MRRRIRFVRCCFLFLLTSLLSAGWAMAAQQVVAGSRVDGSVRLQRVLLLLKPSADQETKLDTLLKAQQTPGQASYHQWLTQADFASQFRLSPADAGTVAAWLAAQGFEVAALPPSRGWIEFSGTTEQVEQAFSVQVEAVTGALSSAGEPRYEIAGEAHLPAAIAYLVDGLVSLDGGLARTAATAPVSMTGTAESLAAKPITAAQAITPEMARGLLHLTGTDLAAAGAGETIVFPARSNVDAGDFAAFRRAFGLPAGVLVAEPDRTDADLNGPGLDSDRAAVTMAASWAGVAAPSAKIAVVTAATTNATDGLDLALALAVDGANGALGHTISVGYSACESSLSAAHRDFYAALYRQAAAEGVAIVAASGDSGAAACHDPADGGAVSSGLGVNALAATPWNTALAAAAVKTADLDAANVMGSTSSQAAVVPWQSTADIYATAYATGGGASTHYPTPDWQSASGLPASDPGTAAAHHRYLPDISLPAAGGTQSGSGLASPGLAFCFSGATGSEASAGQACSLVSGGGSAASAAIFAGIAAVLAEKYGAQGNLAPRLYAKSRSEIAVTSLSSLQSSRVFSDITAGTAKLPCVAGSPDCQAAGLIGFDAGDGYDLASGLGSINADLLIRNWATPDVTGTAPASVEMTTINSVTYNPSATIVLSAKVISGSGGTVPTGTVQFYDETVGANTGTAVTLSSTGTASYSEEGEFSQGNHNIVAEYSGDSTYAAGSSQPITINVQPSATTLIVTPSTLTPGAGAMVTVTGTVTATELGSTPPTGNITINLDGIAQGTAPLSTVSSITSASVIVTIPTTGTGSHAIQGTYTGDTNYVSSTSAAVTVTVTKLATVTSVTATPSTLSSGTAETLTATLAPFTATTTAYSITGTVAFYDGTTLLGTGVLTGNTAVLTGVALSAASTHIITAVYSGDASYSTSTSTPLVLASTLAPVTVTLTASTAIVAPGQAVTLTAVVTPVNTPATTAEQHPSGYVLFYAGTTLVSGQVPVLVGQGYSGTASTFVSSLPAGEYTITAVYQGDPTYAPATSNALNLGVEDFAVSCSLTNISLKQGTTSVPITCNVAALGGLTGSIQVTCAEQNPPTVGAIACSFNPSVVDGTGQTSLTIVTAGKAVAQNEPDAFGPGRGGSGPHGRGSGSGSGFWPAAGGGVALAFAGFLLVPVGRRAQWLRGRGVKLIALVLLLAGMAGAGLGCNNSSPVVTNSTATPLGVHTLVITAGSLVNTVTVTHVAYLTVDVTP